MSFCVDDRLFVLHNGTYLILVDSTYMASRYLRDKAITLRKLGKTYGEIKVALGVPKSTLSGWLSNYPLTAEQIKILESNRYSRKLAAVEKTTLIKLAKRKGRLQETYDKEEERLIPLTERELYLCGLFLYWGEGVKGMRTGVSLNNTDPQVVKFYYYWLTKVIGVKQEKIKVLVHLYNDMNVEESLSFWSNLLKVPRSQFIKPYIKKSSREGISQKGFGHGTCCIYVYNQYLKEKIMLGLGIIAERVTGLRSRDLI